MTSKQQLSDPEEQERGLSLLQTVWWLPSRVGDTKSATASQARAAATEKDMSLTIMSEEVWFFVLKRMDLEWRFELMEKKRLDSKVNWPRFYMKFFSAPS